MEYVMVPVPEEHVGDVENFLRVRTAKAMETGLDQEAAARLLHELDEHARRVLLDTASAAEEGVVRTIGDAAKAAGCTEREVLGLLVELNSTVASAGGPPLTVIPVLRTNSATRPLTIAPNIAQLFLAAERGADDHG
jgi:hypothetical protein